MGRVSDPGGLAVPGSASQEACSVGLGVCRCVAYGLSLVSAVQARTAGQRRLRSAGQLPGPWSRGADVEEQ